MAADDKERSNWEVLKNKPRSEQTKYRNVYEEQQLERGEKPKKISKTSRMVILWATTAAMVLGLWLIISVGEIISYAGVHGGFPEGTSPASFFGLDLLKLFLITVITVPVHMVFKHWLLLNLRAQNLLADDTDINEHLNDQHIALPEEVMSEYDWFPDVGAHSSVSPSTMVSHVMLENKGIDRIDFVQPDESDDADAEAEFYAKLDNDRDELTIVKTQMFDHDFGDALFEASGLPKDLRKWFDPRKIPYNPGNANRDKLKGYERVSDLVNGDWEVPLYEVQRPAGAYIVDGAPVNTMVLAITRAGKGQTVIEPTIDMWTREKRPNNILINDPKGELLVKFYVPAVVRGFMPIQFNLINELKTDIFNPLALASEAAREADFTQCSTFIENIATVFFPLDGGEDPVWPNAANNAFKRACYGMIDYYLEEERVLRNEATCGTMTAAELDVKLDKLWGHVTLYNCYQLFVQLTAKKRKSPLVKMNDIWKRAEQNIDSLQADERAWFEDKAKWGRDYKQAEFAHSHFWNGANEADEMALYFAATACLPNNGIRTLVVNADNSLKSMGAAEKMLASCDAFCAEKAQLPLAA